MRRFVRLFLGLIFVAALCAGGIFYWGYTTFHAPGPGERETVVLVPKGAGLNTIAALLQEHRIIRYPAIFVWGTRAYGEGRAIRAGEYAFQPGASPRQVLTVLTVGKTVLRRLTIPEGLSAYEVAALINGADGLQGTVPVPDEGSVLPETYSYEHGESRARVLERMQAAMRETLAQLGKSRAKNLPLTDPQQAVVLASIVEKETGVPTERARVAAVFVNRLRRGMRLQSDPTVVYGITLGEGPLGRPISRKDLDTDHPYNTYRIPALPPGPIANPGRDALVAVMHPAETDEFYFVADGTGGHVFAKTLSEHNRNVVRWRKLQKRKNP